MSAPATAGRLAFRAVPSWMISGLSLLPACAVRQSSLHPPFVHLVVSTVVPLCVGPPTRLRTAVEGYYSSAPGALAQVRVIVSRTVITYSAPSVPLAGTSRFHRMAAYIIRDAFAVR